MTVNDWFLLRNLSPILAGPKHAGAHENTPQNSNKMPIPVPLKIYSANRMLRKGVMATSFQDLLAKCKDKFRTGEMEIKIVLDADGVEVDEEFFPSLAGNTTLMLLNTDEEWGPLESLPGNSQGFVQSELQTIASTNPLQMMGYIEKLKTSKRKATAQLSEQKRSKKPITGNIKLIPGWLHYDFIECKYKQVRSSLSQQLPKGDILIPGNYGYQETLKHMEQLYFPRGRNFRGRIATMITKLGNSHGDEIASDQFTDVYQYSVESVTQKVRLYLLTKKKIVDVLIVSESSSADEGTSNQDFIEAPQTPRQVPQNSIQVLQNSIEVTPNSTQIPQNSMQQTSPNQLPYLPQQSNIQPWTPNGQPNPTHVPAGTPTVLIPVDRRCPVCYDRERNAIVLPCIHTFCLECALQVEGMGQTCPQCRGPIGSVREMF